VSAAPSYLDVAGGIGSRDGHSDREEGIVTVATELFFEYGFRGVGVRMIASSVGLQASSLYHYFPNKERILYRIVRRATSDFIDSTESVFQARADAPGTLRQLVRAHVVYFGEHRLAQQVAERELRELTSQHYDEVRGRQRTYLDAVTRLIVEGCARGSLQVEHPRVAALALLDMLNSFNRWYEPRPPLEIPRLADMYAEMIVDGLLAAGRRRRDDHGTL